MLPEYQEVVVEREKHFSEYARHSLNCAGRRNPLNQDDHRTEFERDCHRTLHSLPFRRLRHKTQVFFAPKNDHICTRMEHALHVATIASTICNHLDLNSTLAEAIALAHDLGHPPFGHLGEEALVSIHRQHKLHDFTHEAQSLRIIDHFKDSAHRYALNLTYEVRDGVVCHYGEGRERSLQPDRNKDIRSVEPAAAREQRPATLEGCVVRMADRIAYLGRDYEDAVEAGIIGRGLPGDVEEHLGTSNSQIVGALIRDVIQASRQEPDKIQFSDRLFPVYIALLDFNRDTIYRSGKLITQHKRIRMILKDLFDLFGEVLSNSRRDKKKREDYSDGYVCGVFYDFLDAMEYPDETPDAQVVSDFVSGMTDNFTIKAFQDLFIVSSPA